MPTREQMDAPGTWVVHGRGAKPMYFNDREAAKHVAGITGLHWRKHYPRKRKSKKKESPDGE